MILGRNLYLCYLVRAYFFVAVSRTSLAGLQTTVTTLPCADYTTEVQDSLLSILTHIQVVANEGKLSNEGQLTEYNWAVANKDELSNENRLSEYRMCLQLDCVRC